MPHFYPLSARQLLLLALVAQGMEPPAIAEHLADELPCIADELSGIVAALEARDHRDAVVLAATHCGMRPPAAMSDEIAAIVAAGRLDPPVRQLLQARAGGASDQDLLDRTGADTVEGAVSLGVLAGLHHPTLIDRELEHLRHALLGHGYARCVGECGLGAAQDMLASVRAEIFRKFGVEQLTPQAAMTAAVSAAIRSGQLKQPRELAARVALVARDGVPADMLLAIRALSCGVERADIANVCGLVEYRVREGLKMLAAQIDLRGYDVHMRSVAIVAVVLWAGEPERPPEPQFTLSLRQLVVLHYLALGHPIHRIAAELALTVGEVKGLIRGSNSVLSSNSVISTVARAVAAGVIVLPKSQQPALEKLRAAALKPRTRALLQLLVEGKDEREIAKLDDWAGRPIQDILKLERARLRVGTTINLIALAVAVGQVHVGPFELVDSGDQLHPPIDEQPPWAELTSYVATRDGGVDPGPQERLDADQANAAPETDDDPTEAVKAQSRQLAAAPVAATTDPASEAAPAPASGSHAETPTAKPGAAHDGRILERMRKLCKQIPRGAGAKIKGTTDEYLPAFPPAVEDYLDAHRAHAIRAVRTGELQTPPGLEGFVGFLRNKPSAGGDEFDFALIQAVADGRDPEEARVRFPDKRGATVSHLNRIQRTMRVTSVTGATVLALWAGWIR